MTKEATNVEVVQRVVTDDHGWFVGYQIQLMKGSLDPDWILDNAEMLAHQIKRNLIQAVKDEMAGKPPDKKVNGRWIS